MSKPRVEHPELDKLAAVSNDYRILDEFFDYLQEQGLSLGKWHGERYVMASLDRALLLYDYFGLDHNSIEAERRALLDYQRRSYGVTAPDRPLWGRD